MLSDPAAQAEAARLVGGLVQFLVLARLLSVSQYGQLAVLYFAASLVGPVVAVRGTMVNVKRAAHGERQDVLMRAVGLSALKGATATAAFAALFASVPSIGIGPIAAAGVLLSEVVGSATLQGIGAIHQGRLSFERYRDWTAVTVVARVVAVVAFAALAPRTLAAWGTVVGLVTVVFAAVGYTVACRAVVEPQPAPANVRQERWEASVFALNALTLRISDDLDKALLAALDSYAAAGVYTVAYRIASYVLFPSRAVMGRFMPMILKEGAAEACDWRPLVRQARRELVVVLAAATPILVLGAFVTPLVFGARYTHAVPMAIALLPLLGLRGFHWMYGDVLIAVGRIRSRLVGQAASLVIPIAVYLGLVPVLGAWGAVLGTGLGEAIAIGVMRAIAIKETRTAGRLHPSPHEPGMPRVVGA